MTIKDLAKNRDRVIRKIKFQSKHADVKSVMTKMVTWLNTRTDIQDMKPTMKNIDSFTYDVTASWIKNDWNPAFTRNQNDAMNEIKREENMPSSLRR